MYVVGFYLSLVVIVYLIYVIIKTWINQKNSDIYKYINDESEHFANRMDKLEELIENKFQQSINYTDETFKEIK